MISRATLRVAQACIYRRPNPSIFPIVSINTCHQLSSPFRQPKLQVKRPQTRTYATPRSLADEKIEEIQEQYATAKDEFEIAVEETEKKSIYAAEDRAAAQEELQGLKELFDEAVASSDPDTGKEIRTRVGQRIRELDSAIQGLEETAKED
ncbi:hypothetical protein MMC10_006870 [Thelotrema lepadinum]|nr:hypothetical protein [Thelotrema lepadinum]